MSQHITGHVGQSVSHEYGEFIRIGDMRIRKSVIIGYRFHENIIPDKPNEYGVLFYTGGQWQFKALNGREEAENEIARLDWIYEKDYK